MRKIPEHRIFDSPNIVYVKSVDVNLASHQFGINFDYDDFPNDFIYEFSAQYQNSPLLQISVIRPDGIKLDLLSTSLPQSNTDSIYNSRIFSTDETIRKNLLLQSENFDFSLKQLSPEYIIFSQTKSHESLKGNYIF